ncbi:dienelactone hydrolase family protein [mine drainage metagenome]
MGSMISYKRPDGQTASAYLVKPKGSENAPAIVVIQEWWGLNDQIKSVADRLAGAGYQALVPDLYRGKLALEENEANHLMNGLDFADAASQDVRGAVQYLKSLGIQKVGITGFCMGGALTLLSSVFVPELDAAVIWYGYPPLEYVDATKISVPIMGHWATLDDVFTIGGVDALEKKLTDSSVPFEFFRYNAKHAFANEEADSKNLAYLKHDAKSAELAWIRTMEFLKKHL